MYTYINKYNLCIYIHVDHPMTLICQAELMFQIQKQMHESVMY
jgi:hypothetical protein